MKKKPEFKIPSPGDNFPGTSFHDVEVKMSFNQMKAILGEPTYAPNDGEDKVNIEWVRKVEHQGRDIFFTVYDWKYYRPLEFTEQVKWHIGGENHKDTLIAAQLILGLEI